MQGIESHEVLGDVHLPDLMSLIILSCVVRFLTSAVAKKRRNNLFFLVLCGIVVSKD